VIRQYKRRRLSQPLADHEVSELPLSGPQRLLLAVAVHIASLVVAAAELLPPASKAVRGE
jgi:hypothetical protein